MKPYEPAEDAQNQVENEKRSKNHQADKVNPGKLEAYGIIHLRETRESGLNPHSRNFDRLTNETRYPVEDVGPPLHRDALEHRQHGEEEVVKVGDPSIGTVPPAPTLCAVDDTLTAVAGKGTRHRVVFYIVIWRTMGTKQGKCSPTRSRRKPPSSMYLCTCPCVVAGPVHASNEELQTDDGVDDDDKENQQGNVEQGNHGLHDGVEHDLQT